MEVTALRRRVSMVFQQPNPFPMSVFDNVAYALREQGSGRPRERGAARRRCATALERAGLWDEVADNLDHPALRLSGGQQQRLCIARALAAGPEVLLLDEPCSALDPTLDRRSIEELILELRDEVAVVIVTHNLQQAYRVADHVGFMYLGELVEYGPAEQVFGAPREAAHARLRGRGVRMTPDGRRARWRSRASCSSPSPAASRPRTRAPSSRPRPTPRSARRRALQIDEESKDVKVGDTVALTDENGAAVVVSSRTRRTGPGGGPDRDRRPRREGQERLQERHARAWSRARRGSRLLRAGETTCLGERPGAGRPDKPVTAKSGVGEGKAPKSIARRSESAAPKLEVDPTSGVAARAGS